MHFKLLELLWLSAVLVFCWSALDIHRSMWPLVQAKKTPTPSSDFKGPRASVAGSLETLWLLACAWWSPGEGSPFQHFIWVYVPLPTLEERAGSGGPSRSFAGIVWRAVVTRVAKSCDAGDAGWGWCHYGEQRRARKARGRLQSCY